MFASSLFKLLGHIGAAAHARLYLASIAGSIGHFTLLNHLSSSGLSRKYLLTISSHLTRLLEGGMPLHGGYLETYYPRSS